MFSHSFADRPKVQEYDRRMARREETLRRTQTRVQDLIAGFGDYVEAFESVTLFTGPSLYFHFKTLERLRRHRTPADALADELFVESLYATLASWGLHRMGPGNARLVEFLIFKRSLLAAIPAIESLGKRTLSILAENQVPAITRELWSIIRSLAVGIGGTKIVSGSKALHHILPDLVPPIDREYTIRFFCHHKTLHSDGEEEFAEIYPGFRQIFVACESEIGARLKHPEKMHTSLTKVIDNTIVGYRLRHTKDGESPMPT